MQTIIAGIEMSVLPQSGHSFFSAQSRNSILTS